MSDVTDGFGIDPKKLSGLVDAGFTAPDVIGTIEGWRAWKVDRDPPRFGTSPKLYSATYNYFWAPRVAAQAECDRGCNDPDQSSRRHVPGEDCTCGFYSAKSLKHLRRMTYHIYNEHGQKITVIGQMANWGKVIPGTQGWRAEYAYPAVLFVPFEGWRLAEPLQKAYGVPVKLLNLLDDTKFPEEAKDIESEVGL